MEIRMAEIAELSIALLLILFAMVSKTQMFIHGNSQAFMPANNEVRWNIGIVDGMPVSMHKDVPTPPGRTPYLEDNSFYRSRSNIKFEPSLLDFQERHLGVPHGEKVTLINMNNNKTIHMSSISGNTVHFHCSFFEDKVIPPLGNTTFNVVFLGREEGKIHSTLFIHTSEGSFKYQVTGTGVMSPYRLRPLVGVRMPLNSSFTPLIHMHNPHTFPLQIVEVYSSGGELCLELPSGEMEGPKNLWEILPFETKPVIRAKFVGLSEKNHTVYIRIIVNSTMDYLVVPLEVEVGPQAGLYSPDDLIDFGLSGSTDAPKVAKLYLLNSGRKSIQIQNVISTPVSKAVKIDFKPIKVPPDSLIPTEVATVTFDSRAAFETKHFSGKIVAKGKQSGGGAQKVVVPYGARVLPGGLSLNASAAHFCTDQPPGSSNLPQPRNFTMTNSFAIPVAVHNVSLAEDHRKYFLIKHFVPVILDPGETSVLFQIGINEELVTANFTLESSLYLHTNVSKLCIPLLCYNGRLKKVILPTEAGSNTEDIGGEINFGLVGSGRKKDSYFAVVNENPVEIRLKSWGTNLSSTESGEAVLASVELAGVDSGNISSLLARHLFHNMTKSLVLKPHQYAVFKIAATAPSREGWLEGVAFVETQFERLSLAVKMRSAKGSLDVLRETLVFDECFPGKLCEQPLEVVSSFEVPMVAKSVVTHPPDARVTFFPASVDEGRKCGVGESKPSSSGTPTLPSICPHGTSLLGHLTFNPKAACGDYCYLGVSAAHKGGSAQWAQGAAIPVHSSSPNVTPPAALPSHIAESDSALVDILHSRFAALAGWQNVSLRLDTSEARRVAFKAAARLVWPRLLWWKGSKCTGSRKLCPPANSRQDIRFPLTHVANTSFLEVTLENPSDSPLLMQLALQYAYPQAKRVLDLLPRSLQPPPNEGEEATSSEEFRFAGLVPGPHWQWVGPGSGVGLPTNMPNGPSSNPASGGLLPLFLLQPKKSLTVQLTFKPLSPNLSSTLIFIRNNLTALEVVRVSGQGGYAQFRFGNRKPGNPSPLLFELTEKHLKDCERETPWKYSMPNLTVKRSFTARNTGDLPVFVTGLDIDGLQCEGYGFRILSCGPFEMPANGTHKVEIAFTPDFTLSKVQRVLRIHSGGGAAGSTISNYTMLASLPTYMLAPCSSVLPRPNWESRLYVAVLSFCVILFLIAIAAAFFESDRILKCTLVAMASSAAAAAAVSSPAANTCPPPIPPVNVVCSSHQAWTHPPSQQQNHTDGRKRDGQSSGRAMHAGTGWVGMTNRDRHEDDGMVRSGDISEVSLSSKGKKKLGRRNGGYKGMSHIGSTSVRVDRVDMAMSTSRSSEDTCLLEVPKESSKRGIGKGVSGKQQSSEGACSEEETCSTTTESSNNEEMEKSAFQENDLSSRQNKERSKSDSLISSSPLPSVITSTNHSKVPSPALPNSRSSSNGSSAPSPSSMSSSSASSSSSSSPPADFRDNYEGDCDEEDDYGGSRDHKTLGAALRAAERSCELSVTSQGTSNIGGVQKPKGAVAQASKATSYQKQSSSLEAAEGGKSRGGGDISRAATAAPSLELPYKPKPLKNVGRDRVKDGKGMSVVVTGKRRAADKTGTIPRGLNDMDHAITRPVPPPPQRQQTPPPPPSSSPHQIPSWDAHRMRGNNQSHPTDSPSPPILYSNVVSSYPLSLSGERQYPLLGPAVSRPSAIPATRGQLDRPEEVCARKKNQSRGRSEDGASNMSMPTVPMAPGGIPRGILGPIGRGPARPRLQASVPQVTPTLRLPPAWTTAVHSRPLSSQTATSSVQSLQSPPHDSHLFSDSFAKVPLQHESYASQVNSVGYVGDNLSCNTTGQGPIGTVGGASVLSGRNVWEQQSIMKVLQEERRKRVEEHQRINTLKDNWPGFDSQPSVSAPSATAESLWDPIYSPPSSIQSGLDKEVEQHLQKVNLQQSSAENHTDNPWTTFGDHGVWSSSVWMSSEGSAPHTPSSVEAPTQTHIGHHPPGLAPRAAVTLASVSSPPGLTLPPVTPLTSSSGFESLNHLITGSNRSPSMEAPLERAMDFDPFRSLGDIWSPRTMDSWSHNNNNNGNLQE